MSIREKAWFNSSLKPHYFVALSDAESMEREKDAKIERLQTACSKGEDEVQQILGKALGYPRYCDDLAVFPEAKPEDGVCVGEHTAASLADEAAAEIARLRQQFAERDELLWEARKHVNFVCHNAFSGPHQDGAKALLARIDALNRAART